MGPSAGAGVVLISPKGNTLRYAIRLHFKASNNDTEYEALVNGLRIAIELGATRLYVLDDSELVDDQVMKESSCKSPLMAAYCQELRKLEGELWGIELHHVQRKDNDTIDSIAKLAAKQDPVPDGVFMNDLHEPSARIQVVVRRCERWQFYAWQTHLPAQELQTIPITWPFVFWGLDMVGPLKSAPGGRDHLLVAVDRFTKLIEAKPITNIGTQEAVGFFLNIVYQFGVPNCIITDNRTNFTGKKFLDFYDGYGFRVDWASVGHSRTNGQVE
ncbi:uncharacterized protein LOC106804276 [Setaria italica]|uniref:uncharacterized protein LOC106804276 n=1 Tax=Setaria italica TaxID=4555 RepID=UPI0007199CCF|nr:uncharacterized protein LOC106804276 [Setaria italica]